MITWRGGCSRGRLGVVTDGEPVRSSVCHCLARRRRVGSVFGARARFRRADVEVTGPRTAYRRVAGSGDAITFHVCPSCGLTVHSLPAAEPDLIAAPSGAFSAPSFQQPTVSFHESRRHLRVGLPDDIEHID